MERVIEDIRLDVLRLAVAAHPGRPDDALGWAERALLLVEPPDGVVPVGAPVEPAGAVAEPPRETVAQAIALGADDVAVRDGKVVKRRQAGGLAAIFTDERIAAVLAWHRTGRPGSWAGLRATLAALPGPPLVDRKQLVNWWFNHGRHLAEAAPTPTPPPEPAPAAAGIPTPEPVIRDWCARHLPESSLPSGALPPQWMAWINDERRKRGLGPFALRSEAVAA
jgi:hypothetical protein